MGLNATNWGFGGSFGSGGGGGSTAGGNTQMKNVLTGALTANNPVSIPHGITGCTNFTFVVSDANNDVAVQILKVDPAAPLANFIIEVGIDLPAGLTVHCFGTAAAAPLVLNEVSGNTTGAIINAAGGILTITGVFTPILARVLLFTWLDTVTGDTSNFPVQNFPFTQTVKVNIGAPLPVNRNYVWDILYV
jgi:hypothetical protein